ncbi:MAG: hypothetical protein HKN13_07715 [Rhodothermales bacterium]|nr:hypothetical protein [Rhodothermales bacterium]
MKNTRAIAWIVGAWLLSHVVLIAGHVLLIFLYSTLIAPGLEPSAYQDFALASGPWYSILLGGPVFYVVGRLFASRFGSAARRFALIVWALYSITDLTIVLMVGTVITPLFATQWLVSQGVKLIAVLLATRRSDNVNGDSA